MCGLEAVLRGHEKIDHVSRPGDSLVIPLGIGEDLSRLREKVTARRLAYIGAAPSAERLVLLAGDYQDALGVGRGLGEQDVGAQVLARRDHVLPVPPYLGKLLFEVDLVMGAEERVGPSWLVG